MSLVDRFVCRREGHKPSVVFRNTSTGTFNSYVNSYVCPCVRCGKQIEVKPKLARTQP